MKRLTGFVFLVCLILLIPPKTVYSKIGDTIVVQAFTFGSPQNAKFLFPDTSHHYSRILMKYKLKCNPAQNPACGEWDYLTYNYLYEHTGRKDSTLFTHANFQLDGLTADSLMIMNSPGWYYSQRPEFHPNGGGVPSAISGNGNISGELTTWPSGKTLYLWKAADLISAGLSKGNITGLRLFFNMGVNSYKYRNFKIRMASASVSLLDAALARNSIFTLVFSRNLNININGWNNLGFSRPFYWDGISDLLIDFYYDDMESIGNNLVKFTDYGTDVALSCRPDYYLSFNGPDYVDVPATVFGNIDSAVTIAFWQFGDTLHQPQDNCIFEGIDSAGQRVINCHLPWSNGQVYWDAGNNGGSYDRINKSSDSVSQYKGQWNYWAFTKDVKSGSMNIYLNGRLWLSGSGKTRRMKNIRTFKIGSSGNGGCCNYDGFIDQFSIWDRALDTNAIRKIMFNDLPVSDTSYKHLKGYFKFNEGSGLLTKNEVNTEKAVLCGLPDWKKYDGSEILMNFIPSTARPNMIFEQGVFDSTKLIKKWVTDSIINRRLMVVLFDDKKNPALATDTIFPWESYFKYHFDTSGNKTDSLLVEPDSVLHKIVRKYYGAPFEVVNNYEIGRYITPYGNGLDLGNGFSWTYDVTDYAPMLHDSVHLSAGNWQELMEMKFLMIEGTPPRDVKSISTVYQGSTGYNAAAENNFLAAKKLYIPIDAKTARLKMRVTGHGMGGNDNCSEFCAKTHIVKINDVKCFDHLVWRDDCSLNPLYPQGGTWVFSRANWCPGAEVRDANFEITPFIKPGDSIKIDYDFQPYTWNGQGSGPNYVVTGQLITYGSPHFMNDAAMIDIISPSDQQLFSRLNPICSNPKIIFRNNGKNNLVSLDIFYGPEAGNTAQFHWTGKLEFQQEDTIELPAFNWGSWAGSSRFRVRLAQPNGLPDEYQRDDTAWSLFKLPPVMPTKFVLYLKTNHAPEETSYKLEDAQGNILYARDSFEANTLYKDTFVLADKFACYKFTLRDAGDDGLKFWYNMPPLGNGTAGSCKFRDMSSKYYQPFNADFGREQVYEFTTFYGLKIDEGSKIAEQFNMELYPNPAKNKIYADIQSQGRGELKIFIYDSYGRQIKSLIKKDFISDVVEIELNELPAGIYYCTIITKTAMATKRFVVER